MQKLRFPVIRNPWEKDDYLILLHTPVRHARPGFTPTYMRVVGINRKGEHKQFSVPLLTWQLADQNPITLIETDAPDTTIAKPVTGSKLTDPWKVGFTVVDGVVAAHAEAQGNHYLVQGLDKDGREKKIAVNKGVFNAASLRPRVFVQVEDDHAALALVRDPLSA